MSIDLANIRMLRALSGRLKERGDMALDLAERSNGEGLCEEGAAAIVLAGLSAACRDTADDLEQNPIRLPGETERLDNPET